MLEFYLKSYISGLNILACFLSQFTDGEMDRFDVHQKKSSHWLDWCGVKPYEHYKRFADNGELTAGGN